jgi:hypothetical protein
MRTRDRLHLDRACFFAPTLRELNACWLVLLVLVLFVFVIIIVWIAGRRVARYRE